MTELKESPSQTAGPYVHIGCVPQTAGLQLANMGPQLGSPMILGEPDGQRIMLEIMLLDGAGDPVKDALVEIWQASARGHFVPTQTFSNWGRQATDFATGLAVFDTIKPGCVQGQAPHVLVWIVARGINLGLTTRIYFPDEDNTQDTILRLAAERAESLIALQTDRGYAHTIHLQGDKETVFFDV